jgi:hypothetical protein
MNDTEPYTRRSSITRTKVSINAMDVLTRWIATEFRLERHLGSRPELAGIAVDGVFASCQAGGGNRAASVPAAQGERKSCLQ